MSKFSVQPFDKRKGWRLAVVLSMVLLMTIAIPAAAKPRVLPRRDVFKAKPITLFDASIESVETTKVTHGTYNVTFAYSIKHPPNVNGNYRVRVAALYRNREKVSTEKQLNYSQGEVTVTLTYSSRANTRVTTDELEFEFIRKVEGGDEVFASHTERARLTWVEPLSVWVELTGFKCRNADEDSWYSDGDEPYFFSYGCINDEVVSKTIVPRPIAAEIDRNDRRDLDVPVFSRPERLMPGDVLSFTVVWWETDASTSEEVDSLFERFGEEQEEALDDADWSDPLSAASSVADIAASFMDDVANLIGGLVRSADPDDLIGTDTKVFSYDNLYDRLGNRSRRTLTGTLEFRNNGASYEAYYEIRIGR